MGISRYLKSGYLRINSKDRCLEFEGRKLVIPYSKISPSDWGFVYEKYVGQILEFEGYMVSYNGLDLSFFDQGIDLIAKRESNILFIQCKFSKQRITKSKIDWILYKASNKLYKEYNLLQNKISFLIIVNKKEDSFSRKIPKGFRMKFTADEKIEFPILQYFLDHNFIQNKVKLEFREIEMVI
jgi:Holliday junction resolvase-like predicted endonuclease